MIQEAISSDVPWRSEVVRTSHRLVDGAYVVPTAPGLGVEVDERAAARHPWQPELMQRYFHPDGAVADW